MGSGADTLTRTSVRVAIPSLVGLIGFEFHVQGAILARGGTAVTNGLRVRVEY